MPLKRRKIGNTTFLSATTTLCTSIGFLRIRYLSVFNPVKQLSRESIRVTRNGKNVITTRSRILPNGVIIQTEKVGPPYVGIRNVRLKNTPIGKNRYRVTGVIDGKAVVPYVVRCGKNGCVHPEPIRFKDGTVLHFSIDKKSNAALQRLYRKFNREIVGGSTKKSLQANPLCTVACQNQWSACCLWSFGLYCQGTCTVIRDECLEGCRG